jgi:hypothetical protein
MKLDEICALPVEAIAAPDSVLFLWITAPLLPDGLTVMQAWGFTYKSNFGGKKSAPTATRPTALRPLLFRRQAELRSSIPIRCSDASAISPPQASTSW